MWAHCKYRNINMWIKLYIVFILKKRGFLVWLFTRSAPLFEGILWARICKRLRSPGFETKESIPPTYVAWWVGTATLFEVQYRPTRLHRLPGIDSKFSKRLINEHIHFFNSEQEKGNEFFRWVGKIREQWAVSVEKCIWYLYFYFLLLFICLL
jgi:hypothetical protein